MSTLELLFCVEGLLVQPPLVPRSCFQRPSQELSSEARIFVATRMPLREKDICALGNKTVIYAD